MCEALGKCRDENEQVRSGERIQFSCRIGIHAGICALSDTALCALPWRLRDVSLYGYARLLHDIHRPL